MEYFNLIATIVLIGLFSWLIIKSRRRTGLAAVLVSIDGFIFLVLATYFVITSIHSLLF